MKLQIKRHCVGYQFYVKEFSYILVTYSLVSFYHTKVLYKSKPIFVLMEKFVLRNSKETSV